MSIDGIRAVDKEPVAAFDFLFGMSIANGQRVGPRPVGAQDVAVQIGSALPLGAVKAYPSVAAMNADTAPAAGTLAYAEGKTYRKTAVSGSAGWEVFLDFIPGAQLISAPVTGGTPNAVLATSASPVSAVAYKQLILVGPFSAANPTAGMTVSINGEAPRALVTNTGDPIPPNYVRTKMSALVVLDADGKYRLFSYGDASAIQAAAEAAKLAAEAARDVTLAALSSVISPKATRALAIADNPGAAPDPAYYDVKYFDTNYTPNSSARYKISATNPGTPDVIRNRNGTGAYYSIEDSVLRPQMFGARGDGITNDADAIEKTIRMGRPIDWGAATYKYGCSITNITALNLDWRGNGAVLLYDSAAAVIAAPLNIILAGGKSTVTGLVFDAGDRAQSATRFVNLATSMINLSQLSDLEISGCTWRNVYRSSAAVGYGDGIRIEGGFTRIVMNEPVVRNVHMAAGQGVPDAAGVTGIAITYNKSGSEDLYPLNIVINNPDIEGVKSDDNTYYNDQDGILILTSAGSDVTENGILVTPRSKAEIFGGRIKNCLGRGVKGAARVVNVIGTTFEHTLGFNNGKTGYDVDLQWGGGSIKDLIQRYDGIGSDATLNASFRDASVLGVEISGNRLFKTGAGSIQRFGRLWTTGAGAVARAKVSDNFVRATLGEFLEVTVSGNDVLDLACNETWDVTGGRFVALTNNLAVGSCKLRIFANNNRLMFAGVERHLVTDTTAGMGITVTGSDNVGFSDEYRYPNYNALQATSGNRPSATTASGGTRVFSLSIANMGTAVLPEQGFYGGSGMFLVTSSSAGVVALGVLASGAITALNVSTTATAQTANAAAASKANVYVDGTGSLAINNRLGGTVTQFTVQLFG